MSGDAFLLDLRARSPSYRLTSYSERGPDRVGCERIGEVLCKGDLSLETCAMRWNDHRRRHVEKFVHCSTDDRMESRRAKVEATDDRIDRIDTGELLAYRVVLTMPACPQPLITTSPLSLMLITSA